MFYTTMGGREISHPTLSPYGERCNHIVSGDCKKSHRDLMCVGRYAAKVMRNEQSEMEHNQSEMPANIA